MLDEPFASGMDPNGILALKERAREAAARGRTVLYTTQILDVAEGFSDRVCILNKGEVYAYDSVARLGALESIFRKLREEAR